MVVSEGFFFDALSLGVAFVTGVVVSVWRAFTIVNRLSLAEQRIVALESAVKEEKNNILRIEDRIYAKLSEMDAKLDKLSRTK